MLKEWKSVLVVCAGVAFFSGCASTLRKSDDLALLPEIDIVQLKENSDEALKLSQEAKLDVKVVHSKIAEIDNRLVVLSEEVAAVSLAKIEEIENRLALLIEAFKDLQQQMNALEISAGRRPSSSGAKKEGPPTFSTTAAELVTSTEYESYQNALRAFNDRSYSEAHRLFKELLEKYPKSRYASNAHYWVGECFYAEGKFAEAIAAFDRVIAYGATQKADDAQLKIGMSYLKMGKKPQAKESLNILINRYPQSEYVPRAKKYLADLN